jgi:hypothetical protein
LKDKKKIFDSRYFSQGAHLIDSNNPRGGETGEDEQHEASQPARLLGTIRLTFVTHKKNDCNLDTYFFKIRVADL